MKRLLMLTCVAILTAMSALAGNWRKTYFSDEFGDPDYSKPCYIAECDQNDDWSHESMKIVYFNGKFVLEPWLYGEHSTDITSIKAKDSNGKVYNISFSRPDPRQNQFLISSSESVATLMNLLEKGYFTLSFHRPEDYVKSAYNYNYKIGTQGTGIKSIAGVRSGSNGNAAKSTTSTAGKLTFKGKIGGKYAITIVFDQNLSTLSNGGTVTGTYWYGTGKNGKMTLRGTADGTGNINMAEYDPQGKRCGGWNIYTNGKNSAGKVTLSGTMYNAKNQTFSVECTQQ